MYPLLALFLASLLLGAGALWQAWRARRVCENVESEVRKSRVQLSNVVELLMAAGFKKPRRPGWEDDFQATQLKDTNPPDVSWWRPKR